MAYLAHRRLKGSESRFELGAIGHGPNGALLAERLCEHIRSWDTDRAARPSITAMVTADLDENRLPAGTIVKNDCTITITF